MSEEDIPFPTTAPLAPAGEVAPDDTDGIPWLDPKLKGGPTAQRELTYVPLTEQKEEEEEQAPSTVEKGRIIQISYNRTKQVKDFEPVKLEIVSTVAEGEDVEEVYEYLKDMVEYLLNK